MREATAEGAEHIAEVTKGGLRVRIVCDVRMTSYLPVDLSIACACMQLLCRSP